MQKKYKSIASLFSFLLLSSVQAQNINISEQISGHWRGLMADYNAFYDCLYDVEMDAHVTKNQLTLKFSLARANYPALCEHVQPFTLTGFYQQSGELIFNDTTYHGSVSPQGTMSIDNPTHKTYTSLNKI